MEKKKSDETGYNQELKQGKKKEKTIVTEKTELQRVSNILQGREKNFAKKSRGTKICWERIEEKRLSNRMGVIREVEERSYKRSEKT